MTWPWLLLVIAGTFGLGLGLHGALARLLGERGAPPAGALGLGLGMWALSQLVLVLGLAGWLSPWALAVVLGLASVRTVAALGSLRRAPGWRGGRPRLLAAVAGTLLALVLAGNLARSLAPPDAWDGIAYHLALAKLYARAGALVEAPSIRPSHWPLGLDALYVAGEVLGGTSLASLMGWLLGLLALASTGALAAELGGRRAGWLAAAIVAASPVVVFLGGVPLVEAGLAGLVALAMRGALQEAREPSRTRLAALGLVGGLAATVKYTALLCPLLVAGTLVLVGRRPLRGLVVLLASGLGAAPWYLRTWYLTGNPVWPYVFGGAGWDQAHTERLLAFERGYGTGTSLGSLVLAPWRLAFEPHRYGDLMLGPGFLALLPFVAARLERRRLALLGSTLAGFLAWFLATQQSRFLVPLLPLLAACIAHGIETGGWRWAARAARAAAVLLLVSTLTLLGPAVAVRLPVLLGQESRSSYLDRMVSSHAAVRFVNRELRPRRLLLFREVRGYYLDVDYLWGDPLNQTLIDYAALPDAAALGRRLAELGVDAVLVNGREYREAPGYYDRRTLVLMAELLAREGERVWERGAVEVWRLGRGHEEGAAPEPGGAASRGSEP